MLGELTRNLQALYVPTSQVLLLSAQTRLLQHFCGGAVLIESRRSKGGINYVVVTSKSAKAKAAQSEAEKTLLLVHGFGSGLGFFFANYSYLAATYSQVVAIDLLGMGGSDRVDLSKAPRITTPQLLYRFFTGNHAKVDAEVVPRAINFFVDSMEDFCDELNLGGGGGLGVGAPKLHVAGHSLGSFLTWNFALRHKHRVEALVMISPCGVPSPPPDAAARAGATEDEGGANASSPSSSSSSSSSSTSLTFSAIRFLWDNNVTPQTLVRLAGGRGLGIITNVLNRRFNSRWDAFESGLIAEYFYHITSAPASGEYALSSLLRPLVYKCHETGAVSTSIFAKRPIEQDIDSLPDNSSGSGRSSRVPFPVLLLFGDHDWLRFNNVETFVRKAKSKGVDVTYDLVPTAGHHLYLDNSDHFHDSIRRFRSNHGL